MNWANENTGIGRRNNVCLSFVTRVHWDKMNTFCWYCDRLTNRKAICFQRPTMVAGRCTLAPQISTQSDLSLLKKTPTSTYFHSCVPAVVLGLPVWGTVGWSWFWVGGHRIGTPKGFQPPNVNFWASSHNWTVHGSQIHILITALFEFLRFNLNLI